MHCVCIDFQVMHILLQFCNQMLEFITDNTVWTALTKTDNCLIEARKTKTPTPSTEFHSEEDYLCWTKNCQNSAMCKDLTLDRDQLCHVFVFDRKKYIYLLPFGRPL